MSLYTEPLLHELRVLREASIASCEYYEYKKKMGAEVTAGGFEPATSNKQVPAHLADLDTFLMDLGANMANFRNFWAVRFFFWLEKKSEFTTRNFRVANSEIFRVVNSENF